MKINPFIKPGKLLQHNNIAEVRGRRKYSPFIFKNSDGKTYFPQKNDLIFVTTKPNFYVYKDVYIVAFDCIIGAKVLTVYSSTLFDDFEPWFSEVKNPLYLK